MKKLPHITLTLATGVILWAAFLLPIAQAQSAPIGHFVLLQQGDRTTETNYQASGLTWNLLLGNGFTGTTTGAFISASFVSGSSGPVQAIRVLISGYSDPSYSTIVGTCGYTGEDLPPNYSASATSSNPFTQLTHVQSGLNDCTLNPALYYKVVVTFQPSGVTISSIDYFGTASWSPPNGWTADVTNPLYPYFPQFAIVGDNFQITPTASSSGIFLSGALDFCKSAFASSSAPGIVTDIGIAGCDIVSFAFVPTPLSVQQFQDFSTALQNKIPFSYYNDTASILNGATGSSTQNLQSFAMDFSGTALATTSGPIASNVLTHNYVLLSTSTITQYVPADLYNLLYGLEVSAIWVTALFVWYRKIVPTKAKI